MPRDWRFVPHDESFVRQICSDLRVSPLTARVLVSRGHTSGDSARLFLEAKLTDLIPPERLPGAEAAVDRILAAIRDGRRITIYGDYDVDGMTSISLLWGCLNLAGATVEYYIPDRIDEGYGLNCDAIRALHEHDPNQLVISVDCGITSLKEAGLARELGLELIITDHHTLADSLPDAAALVHPRLPGTEYPFGDLCGAGVAFKVAWLLCQKLGDGKKASPRMREYLKGAVGLVAIGTVADVVPLAGENRVIVRFGLAALAAHAGLGLQTLLRVAQLDSNSRLQAEDIAFSLAPRLNAAGRLGQARLAVELLTTTSQDRATALAQYINELNRNRQTVERRIFKQAKEMVAEQDRWSDDPALVLAHDDWHAGVIGIVANRVAEHFEKPTVLISTNNATRMGQGSGRSYANFDLHSGVASCADCLESFGGHQAAVGVKISVKNIETFRDGLCSHVAENHVVRSKDVELTVDAEVSLRDVTHRAVKELEQLGPFGQANARPQFAAVVELAEPARPMGEGNRHLQMRVRQDGTTLRAIAFGKGEWVDQINQHNGPISICFAPQINRFRGRESVELMLADWRDPNVENDSLATSESAANF